MSIEVKEVISIYGESFKQFYDTEDQKPPCMCFCLNCICIKLNSPLKENITAKEAILNIITEIESLQKRILALKMRLIEIETIENT